MFKSFAASLLSAAALARGTADGSSADNAYATELLNESPVKLTLYTYNATTQDEATRTKDVYEFHGDTHLETTSVMLSAVRYGWCIEAKAKVDAADEIPAKEAIDAIVAVEEVKDADGNVTTEAVEGKDAVPATDLIPAVLAADPVWDC
jgi:hypothetical protein